MFDKYTVSIYNLMQDTYSKQAIEKAMSTYPLYKATSERKNGIPNIIPTREELNKAILNYYMFREIGFETPGRFLFELETALNEIMPYYNQLFFSADQDYNVIYNVDYVRTIDRERNENSQNTLNTSTSTEATDTSTTNSDMTTNGKDISSQTPQGQLDVSTKNINNVQYGDNASWNQNISESTATNTGNSSTSGTGTNTGTGQVNDVEGTVETTKGNFGVTSAQDLIKKYREIVINITQQIINDKRISELFMLVY